MEQVMSPWFVLSLLILPTFANILSDERGKQLQEQIDNLSIHLDKFNALYLTTLEQKLTSIATSVAILDTNVKALQEKAHVWDIFQHHILAWTDHMKSVDHKIDLIKLTQDETQTIESKLNSLEFAINHVISKVDTMNEKNRDMNPSMISQKLGDIYKIVYNRERADGYEKKEALLKLSAIMRHVVSIENNSVRQSRNANVGKIIREGSDNFNQNLGDLENKMNRILEEMSENEFEKVITVTEKNSEMIEDILELVQATEERTIRLYDAEANHSSKLLSCCRSSNDELTTFTGSADLLLKRIEKLMLAVQERFEKESAIPKEKDSRKESETDRESSQIEEEKDKFSEDRNAEKSKSEEQENNESNEEKEVSAEVTGSEKSKINKEQTIQNEDVDKPSTKEESETEEEGESSNGLQSHFSLKSGCHELTDRVDGIYNFRNTELLGNRDFNERYCSFPTDGMGWTVIQNRVAGELQENFNRSWIEYKYGFGNLSHDFWFGNELIHRMVYNDSFDLRIELEDFEDVQVWAEYSTFQTDPEKYNYKLMIGGYRGAVTDSMLYHHDMDFSTYDRRNDKSIDECCSCATGYGSGWWFNNCSEANLNGIYHDNPKGHNYIGIIWENWHGDYSLKTTRMLIRPKSMWPVDGDDFPEMPPEDP